MDNSDKAIPRDKAFHKSRCKLIVIEDDSNTNKLLEKIINKHLPDIDGYFFTDAKEALPFIEKNNPAIIVTDWMMPELDGLDLLMEIKGNPKTYGISYIIFLTGKTNSDDLALAINQGADDYIRKPFDKNELIARLGAGVRMISMEAKLTEANKQLTYLSSIDPLTGAFNRRQGTHILETEIVRSKRTNQTISVIIADIDHFKEINDTYGHNDGDEVLIEFTKRLQKTGRPYDSIIRWGGEEFLIICPNTNSENAEIIGERFLKAINSKPIALASGAFIDVTASFGITTVNEDLIFTDIVGKADVALYEAKESGRNKVICHS